jgi:hypothetical protein
MRKVATTVERWRWFSLVASLSAAITAGCSQPVAESSACRNLVPTEAGLSRTEYLPCAGEMLAALDEVATHSQAAARGDQKARVDGEAALGRVKSLMAAAGGRLLLERWRDTALTDLNVDINNAVTKYEAFYMVRILDPSHPFAAKSREAAAAELQGATRRHEEARGLYRRLR